MIRIPVPNKVFARPLSQLGLEKGPGIPKIGSERKPWEGLSSMISETIGSVLTRKGLGRSR
mgnify:CR=1 FL=1